MRKSSLFFAILTALVIGAALGSSNAIYAAVIIVLVGRVLSLLIVSAREVTR